MLHGPNMVNSTSPCVEDSVILGFGQRLGDAFLVEAAQQKHGELAPSISSDLRGEERCFVGVIFHTPGSQYQACYKLEVLA